MASRFWVPGGSGQWNASDTNNWSASSGGSSGASVPTQTDDVKFDGNSGSGTVTIASASNQVCLSFDSTGFTGTFVGSASAGIACRGNWTWGAGVTQSGLFAVSFVAGPSSITSNGKPFGGLAIGSGTSSPTVTLADDLTVSDRIVLNAGTLTATSQNVSIARFLSQNLAARTLNMGSGTWSVSGAIGAWSGDATAFTLNAGTSVLKFTGSTGRFDGLGLTYATVWASGPSTIITGDNTIGTLDITGGVSVFFNDGSTQTIGSGGIVIVAPVATTFLSSPGNTAWNLSKASGTVLVQLCRILNSHASGGATWDAISSTDSGGNTGWAFLVPTPFSHGMILG